MTEADVIQAIQDEHPFTTEDDGIGSYDYGGAVFCDQRLVLSLNQDRIGVEVTAGETVPPVARGTVYDEDLEMKVRATLVGVRDGTAIYELEEEV